MVTRFMRAPVDTRSGGLASLPSSSSRAERLALAGLYLFTLLAVVGYGWFGLNPQRLPQDGFALRLYNVSFQFFAQTQILVALAVLLVPTLRRSGWRLLVPLGIVYLVSFTSEHIGTGYGIPFGGYAYTGLLGARLGPRVPLLIPVSWFLMAVPAWVMARHALGADSRRASRILLGAVWLVVWDLALDPAMSFLTPYWRWEETGPYYGMPWMNLVGWYATGLVLMTTLDTLASWARLDRLPTDWMVAYYGAMVLMPLGMLVAAGAWLAVGVTALGAGAVAVGSRLRLATVEDGAEAGSLTPPVESSAE